MRRRSPAGAAATIGTSTGSSCSASATAPGSATASAVTSARLAGRDELGPRPLLGELLLEERALDPGQRPLRHLDRRDRWRSVDRRWLDRLGSCLGRLSLLAGFGLQLLTGARRSRQGVEQVLIAGRRDRQPALIRGDEDGRRGRREAHDVDRLFAAKDGPANGPAEGAASDAQPGCVRSPQPDAGHRTRAQHVRPAAADPAHLDRGLHRRRAGR